MRIYNYKKGAERRLAVLDDKSLVDVIDALGGRSLAARDRDTLKDTISLIESGNRGLSLARKAIRESRKTGKGRRRLAGAKLFAPLEPAVILCSGENYWDHRDEKPVVEGKEPEFFIKLQQCTNGPFDDIIYEPKITKKLDYETELAIVIGKGGRRHIPRKDAKDHIFGYTIMNDVTARDRQVKMRPDGTSQYAVGPGKNFDTSAPMGPCIVTADELGDPRKLALRTLVNDEVRQSNTTAMMIWDVYQLVQFFSGFVTLKPGSVISTGTPGGTAWGTDPELGGRGAKAARKDISLARGYLRVGDVVTCEIEGIGAIRGKVILPKGTKAASAKPKTAKKTAKKRKAA
ncbi:MAG: fumarylacetoacetate hydrolase family protein [Proteobacteria bacterium]|nr:fumarylacetoacetate hydrolase family protein [Pseudomonadota bacterium]